jgi:hypothetical protein
MIDQHLRAILLQQRGDNRAMVEEVLTKLSPQAKERLFRVLQGMKQECAGERQKRQRGQFW